MTPRERAADLRLRKNYHLSLDEYNRILTFQNGACAICKKRPAPGKPRLAVDHCHTTGLVRGLLCWRCNKSLAAFKDSVDLLSAAAAYLVRVPATEVLGKARITAPGVVGTKKRAKMLRAMLLGNGFKSKSRGL